MIMKLNCVLLFVLVATVARAATDVVPNPSSPGNLGSATNPWPHVYATMFHGSSALLTDLPAGGGGGPIAITNPVSLASMAVNMATPITIVIATNNFTLSVTGAVSGQAEFASVYIWSGVTNRTLVLPSGANYWGCTATNMALSNRWTALHFMSVGADATNVHVKLEEQ
jgi:hypothetical protein